ncbi:MAG: hypothetical protein M1831_000381 [Alyxoria varia]|nr:MAG: hypothetical protein M1831_000381 [Alyxoria varia]
MPESPIYISSSSSAGGGDSDPWPNLLQQLISTASSSDLRAVVRTITRQNDSATRQAAKVLSSKRRDRARIEEEMHQQSAASAVAAGRKRKAMQTCAGCGQEFEEKLNGKGACPAYRYHPRSPEIDYKNGDWEDEYEEDEGVHDTSFVEHPGGYMFPCCGQSGVSQGCTRHLHVARETSASRRRN